MATAAEPAPAPEPMAQAQPPMQRAPISGGRADDLADRLRRQQANHSAVAGPAFRRRVGAHDTALLIVTKLAGE